MVSIEFIRQYARAVVSGWAPETLAVLNRRLLFKPQIGQLPVS